MKPSWEQIVDYVRGFGTDEVRRQIESDPELQDRVNAMRQVVDAAQDQVPEMYRLRAKALLPDLPNPSARTWIGQMLFDRPALQAGYRSSGTQARDLQFTFDERRLDLRIERALNASRMIVVGQFEVAGERAIRVSAGSVETFCDEFGQFDLEVSSEVQGLSLVDLESGNRFEVQWS